eukprot:ctg_177.g71
MGIERRLMERIPEIAAVTAEEESGEPLTAEGVEMVLDQVRPFLKIAGGSIQMDTLENVDGIQPRLVLRMGGGDSATDAASERGGRVYTITGKMSTARSTISRPRTLPSYRRRPRCRGGATACPDAAADS